MLKLLLFAQVLLLRREPTNAIPFFALWIPEESTLL